jgi:hypothetical protein
MPLRLDDGRFHVSRRAGGRSLKFEL